MDSLGGFERLGFLVGDKTHVKSYNHIHSRNSSTQKNELDEIYNNHHSNNNNNSSSSSAVGKTLENYRNTNPFWVSHWNHLGLVLDHQRFTRSDSDAITSLLVPDAPAASSIEA